MHNTCTMTTLMHKHWITKKNWHNHSKKHHSSRLRQEKRIPRISLSTNLEIIILLVSTFMELMKNRSTDFARVFGGKWYRRRLSIRKSASTNSCFWSNCDLSLIWSEGFHKLLVDVRDKLKVVNSNQFKCYNISNRKFGDVGEHLNGTV